MQIQRIKKHLQYEIFLIPALITFTVFTIIPLIKTFYYSFTNFDGMNKSTINFVGMKNFIQLFHDDAITSAIFNTLFYTFCTVILINLIAIPLAILLDSQSKVKSFQRAVFFFPSVVSALLLGYIWGFILSPSESGAINNLLSYFHIAPVAWTSDIMMSKISIIIVSIWANTGWHAVVNLAYLQAIPDEYYEAASIDGANWWQRFKNITFPMLTPALTINVMLLLTNGLKIYDLPYALTRGYPGFSNYTITQVILLRGISERHYGLASAMSVLFFFIMLVVVSIQVTSMRKMEGNIS